LRILEVKRYFIYREVHNCTWKENKVQMKTNHSMNNIFLQSWVNCYNHRENCSISGDDSWVSLTSPGKLNMGLDHTQSLEQKK
jgi:hypothetical protein